ncbi:hypothetical protein JR316_0002831 [Psilocybe cubensis]|uniref:Uncharacterized protein n=1 Tax=Psilocybe cubensis TaxID=181762 RepID=A0ACB8HFH2_PSICU|nr:hypothetical protein JR316_0002831 [Psilocybe cubensis]KAH9485914.1 hypothetical protein JR316_0002831 [Psilocybe cubensis]
MPPKKNAVVLSGPPRRSSRKVDDAPVIKLAEPSNSTANQDTDRRSTLRVVRNPNPGIADAPRPKRTSEEVAKEKKNQQTEQRRLALLRNASIQKAAAIEDQLLQEENSLKDDSFSDSRTHLSKASFDSLPDQGTTLDLPGHGDNDEVPLTSGDISSGGGSDDEYIDKGYIESEDSDDLDDGEGLDDDAELAQATSKGSRKEKRGRLRKQVNAHRLSDKNQEPSVGNKRKGQTTQPSKPAKIKKANVCGIREDWNEETYEEHFDLMPDMGQSLPPSSNASGTSGTSDMEVNDEDEDDVENINGISDDEREVVERRGILVSNTSNSRGKSSIPTSNPASTGRSLAKVEATTSVPTYIPPASLDGRLKRKQEIRAKVDLPSELRLSYDEQFSPMLRELIGIINPWERPSEQQVLDVWHKVFPDVPLEGWLKTVVTKLVENNIYNWRTKLAQTASTCFERSIIPAMEDRSKSGIAEWCKWALSGDYKCRPFYYLSYEEGDDQINATVGVFRGIFQHPLILSTLAYHYSSISAIHSSARRDDKPVGALIMAIQASHRAISHWLTGEYQKIQRPLGDFSKDNWGDNLTRDPKYYPTLSPGLVQESKATSNLLRVVNKLTDKRWEKIIQGAMQATRRHKSITIQTIAPAAPDAVEEPLSDFSIVDNDNDSD